MASSARFLSLAPTHHALVSTSANEQDNLASSVNEQVTEAIDIPVVQKTQRSSSSSTDEDLSVSPTAATDEPVVVDDKARFLKLGN
ncbi:hypothetical protein DV735_g2122, partial [Chaetothyriales sp. CBS 134920]